MAKKKPNLPQRWDFKHGAYYYRPRPAEKHLFDGRSWYRLGATYAEALRTMADVKDIEAGDDLASIIDRYEAEVLPRKAEMTQSSYRASLRRLRQAMGHNQITTIRPKLVYQYMDALARRRTMNIANQDLKVLNQVFSSAVRWGRIDANHIKGEVAYFGKNDGLQKDRRRYVEDWELACFQQVAKPQQIAFAAVCMLIGARKSQILGIMETDVSDVLTVRRAKQEEEDRDFEITEALQDAIDCARAAKPKASFYLFPNTEGRCYVSPNGRCESWDRAWRKTINRAIAETELEQPFTRHDLRAKVGSDQDDERRAQELLGHASVEMTRRHYRRKRSRVRPVK